MKNLRTKFSLLFFWTAIFICHVLVAQDLQPLKKDLKLSPKVSMPKEKNTPAHELTKDDLEAFLDGFMPLQIGQADVAGAVISVVKDGALLFAKGYGYAQVANRVPVSPETLFRPGSISKLFTWTAIMQQVELGKLDLDTDINTYLDFKIPPAFGKPITMRDLMTHRPGFEELYKTVFVPTPENLVPLSQFLQENMPNRIFPPGKIPAYSNYAVTLAGYILERVSGQNYDDYIEEHILKPLGMDHSTFRQPLPDSLKPMMSNGYVLGSGEPRPFEFVQVWPAGSLTASAIDMARFMIMHLQNGQYGDHQVLKPETAKQMHARQEGWPKEMNAMCLGFFEQSENDWRVIGHGGDTYLFHSNLSLILDANVGIYVSYNSLGQSIVELRAILFDAFMNRYFPEKTSQPSEVYKASQDLHHFVGSYESSRRSQTNFMDLVNLFGESKVSVNSDHTISMSGLNGLNQKPLHFQKIGPSLFRDVDGKAKLAFVDKEREGRIVYFGYPFMVYQEINQLRDRQNLNYLILGLSLGVILLTLLAWPIGAMIRRHYERPLLLNKYAKWLRTLVYIVCLVVVLYTIGVAVLFMRFNDTTASLVLNNLLLRILQGLGVVLGVGAFLAIYNAIYAWVHKDQWFWGKIWSTLLALACIGFFWFIYHWNFVNFSSKY